MKVRFQKFDCTEFPGQKWLADYLLRLFQNPKTERAWDVREPAQLERLNAVALGVKQWLKTLPDGAEVGTTDMVKQLAPDMCIDTFPLKFILRRIERCRYAGLLAGHIRMIPDNRWKTPRTFYKYHNGRKVE